MFVCSDAALKVAKKSPRRIPAKIGRATITLPRETYQKIDRMRGDAARSAWIDELVRREEERLERDRLAHALREEYTPAVVRETLALNDSFPVHEK